MNNKKEKKEEKKVEKNTEEEAEEFEQKKNTLLCYNSNCKINIHKSIQIQISNKSISNGWRIFLCRSIPNKFYMDSNPKEMEVLTLKSLLFRCEQCIVTGLLKKSRIERDKITSIIVNKPDKLYLAGDLDCHPKW